MKDFDSYILNPTVEQYIADLSTHNDPVLKEMEAQASKMEFPIIGPLVGKFLYQITEISGATRIFEMGSGFGYSALWFAKALPENGIIICTDKSEDNYKIARGYFNKAGVDMQIRYEVGESLEILRNQNGKFDIILNDIDKEQYPDVIALAEERLLKGGIMITDNVLWFGRVITNDTSISTAGVKKFNEQILSNKNFITTIIPVRDGIAVSLRN